LNLIKKEDKSDMRCDASVKRAKEFAQIPAMASTIIKTACNRQDESKLFILTEKLTQMSDACVSFFCADDWK
jgi:hypothetical protein